MSRPNAFKDSETGELTDHETDALIRDHIKATDGNTTEMAEHLTPYGIQRAKELMRVDSASKVVESLLAESDDARTIDQFAEQYGEQKIVTFIFNRHCSRFDPSTTDLEDALEKAWQYHVSEDEILEDLIRVESHGDLDQYFRR